MEVKSTTDYSLFQVLEGNRELSDKHIRNLEAAGVENPDLLGAVPIICNEKMEVVDGQHRLEAARRLKVPVSYVVGKGFGLGEVLMLNTVQKNWNPIDFARSYAKQGIEPYKIYLDLREEYGFVHSILINFLRVGTSKAKETTTHAFRSGKFEIPNLEASIKAIDIYLTLSKFISKERMMDRSVALAFLKIYQSPNYDHARMLQKLQNWDKPFPNLGDQTSYARLLEEVYNWRVAEESKIRLY